MKKFSSWFMGNQPGRQQKQPQSGRPKKNVHWKSAERPSPPGRPILIPLSDQQPDVVTLKWERPKIDGGSPITSYIIEHRRMGSPHWVRSTPAAVTGCEVSISGLEPGWRYQFRAIAENVVGKSDPSELSDPLTVTLQRNAISVPRFASELSDMSVVENERVEFRVSVLGQPQPEISWFKDGYEIFSSRRTKIVNDNDASVLIIHQVALTDEGEIKCTATNRAGHVVTKAKLMVEAPPKIRLPRNYEDGLIVEADEVLRLKVGIAGQPPPSVVWLHEGEFITNGVRHELVTTDKNSSLKIDNVKRIDRGEYSIRAVNKLGEDTTSFLVTVTSRPYPPGKVRLNTSYGKSATLSWTAPEDDGGCKIGNYIVEYFRIGWNVWLKAATTRQLSTTLNDLIEGSEYKFRVKAENPYGLSDPGDESEVLFIPDPKRSINTAEGDDLSKPIPPRRKALSPQRALPDGEERSGDASPKQLSPIQNRRTKPQILDNEDLHREMSYGMNLAETRTTPTTMQMEVPTLDESRRSPSPRIPDGNDEKKVLSSPVRTIIPKPVLAPLTLPPQSPGPESPSMFPFKQVTQSPSTIAPALGPVLTSALAPVLRFTPVTATTPPALPTPPSPRTPSLNPITSTEPKASGSIKKMLSKQTSTPQNTEPRKNQEKVTEMRPSLSRVRSLSPTEPPTRRTPEEHLSKRPMPLTLPRMSPTEPTSRRTQNEEKEKQGLRMSRMSPTESHSRQTQEEEVEQRPTLSRMRGMSPTEQLPRQTQKEVLEQRPTLSRMRGMSPTGQPPRRTQEEVIEQVPMLSRMRGMSPTEQPSRRTQEEVIEQRPTSTRGMSPTEPQSYRVKEERADKLPTPSRVRSMSPPERPVLPSPEESIKESPSPPRVRSFSPQETPIRRTPPETPPELKKTSQALQRSEEPINLDVNQRVQRYSDRTFSPERQFSQNGNVSSPTIEVSAPGSDPAPLSETEKRDEVHTSNEFMLVVFHKNSKVKDTEKQDSFDLDLEEALQPPPISISSPDLASLEYSNLHTFPLRRSVSSTELLYERAMARFYEAVEMEEAEKAKKAKISQEKLAPQSNVVRKRLGSMSEAERQSFERRSERRRRSADITDLVGTSKSKWDSSDSIANKGSLMRTRGMLNQVSQDTDDGSDYQERPRGMLRQQSQDTDDGSDYRGPAGGSYDVESDYTASTDSVSEDSIEKFKRELVARTRSASTELETYHPRSMTAGVFTPYRAPTAEQSAIVLNRPMPLASPDFVPKPILKRPSNENVVNDDPPVSPTSVVPPSSPTPMSPTMPTSPINEKSDKSKGFKSFFKWDKKTPTEKNTEANAEPPPKLAMKPPESSFESKRRIKEEEEKAKREADRIFQEEAKVVADHYGDIVRQVGSTKKYNPPLYLNRDELKKAAEKAEREGIADEYNTSHVQGKPRMSLIERHQTQHVTKSPSRMIQEEKRKYEEVPSEEEVTPSSTSQLSQRSESRGRKRIVKVKKIIKKRIPSATRSREASSSRPPSSIGAPLENGNGSQEIRPKVVPSFKIEPPASIPEPKAIQQRALVAVPQKTAEELTQEAEEKVRSALSYMTDVCLFIAACYVYLFKDARLVLPILALMVYRQLGEAVRSSIPEWMKKKKQ